MLRLVSILVVLALAVGLYFTPAVDEMLLATHAAGELLREPVREALDADSRAALVAGDRVIGPDGVERELTSVEGDQVTLATDDGELTLYASELTYLVSSEPLWKIMVHGRASEVQEDGRTLVRIRGGRMLIVGALQSDPLLHIKLTESVARTLRTINAEQDDDEQIDLDVQITLSAAGGGVTLLGTRDGDELSLQLEFDDDEDGQPDTDLIVGTFKSWSPPTGRSLLPPLIAILLAILFRRPVLALFCGVLLGSVLVSQAAGLGLGQSLTEGGLNLVGVYFWNEFKDPFRYEIILFVVFMLAMVGVITRAGGIRGLMQSISGLASDVRRTQIATWLMGLVIFFDDYANTILVGTTMRPLTDRFKIAREKLAYIVDSTAAPVAGISIFSTWIAFEVSTFSAQLPAADLLPSDGYSVFMETLPYRFYCLFTLFFVGLIVFTGRDFGPMLTAERRARGGKLLREGATPMVGDAATQLLPSERVTPRASVALIPIAVFVLGTVLWMLIAGDAFKEPSKLANLEGWGQVLSAGGGSTPLMWGSLAGLVVACVLAWSSGLTREIPSAAWTSLRAMSIGFAILYLAWMIGAVCGDLGTAAFLSAAVQDSLNPYALPVVLFLLAGLVAFSTGSSWSTMSILLPLVVGLSFTMGKGIEVGGHGMLVICIGAVLEGAIFGDHCSPISDTTVMSSISSASDHIDHVRTQLPYALVTMGVALVVGYFPAVFLGLSPWLSLLLGAAVLTFIVLRFGHKAEAPGVANELESTQDPEAEQAGASAS